MFRTGWARLFVVIVALWEIPMAYAAVFFHIQLIEAREHDWATVELIEKQRLIFAALFLLSPVIAAAIYHAVKWVIGGFREKT